MQLSDLLKYTKPNGDCLEWTRCFNTDGYPRRGVTGNSNIKVHREVFRLVNGFEPPVVRHSCDNIRCINPDHLLPGTNLDNIRDRVVRGRTHGHVSSEIEALVIALRSQGLSYKEIANQVGLHWKKVDYILYSRKKGELATFVDCSE